MKKPVNRTAKKLGLGIAGAAVLVAFLILAIAKVFIGILPNWFLVPVGIALIVLAVLLPLEERAGPDGDQHDASDV